MFAENARAWTLTAGGGSALSVPSDTTEMTPLFLFLVRLAFRTDRVRLYDELKAQQISRDALSIAFPVFFPCTADTSAAWQSSDWRRWPIGNPVPST